MLFLRAAPIVLLVLLVLYLCLYFYLRDSYRDRLEASGEAGEPAFVDARVRAHADRLRRKLAWAVIAAPLAAMALGIVVMETI